MTINAPAAVLLAMYQAVGEKQGVPPRNLGYRQNDVLKEYGARHLHISSVLSMRLVTDILSIAQDYSRLEHHFHKRLPYQGASGLPPFRKLSTRGRHRLRKLPSRKY